MFARDEIRKTLATYDAKQSYLNRFIGVFFEPAAISCLRAINKDFFWIEFLQFLVKFNAENKLAPETTTPLLTQLISKLTETVFGKNYQRMFTLLINDQDLNLLLKLDYRAITDYMNHSFEKETLRNRCGGLHTIIAYLNLLEGRKLLTPENVKKVMLTVDALGSEYINYMSILSDFIRRASLVYELSKNTLLLSSSFGDGIENSKIIMLLNHFQTLNPAKDYNKVKRNMNALSEMISYYYDEYKKNITNSVLEHFLDYPYCDAVCDKLKDYKYGEDITVEQVYHPGIRLYSAVAHAVPHGNRAPDLLELKKEVDKERAAMIALREPAKNISYLLGQASRNKDNNSCLLARLPDEILKEEIYPRAVKSLRLDSKITQLAINTFFYKEANPKNYSGIDQQIIISPH